MIDGKEGMKRRTKEKEIILEVLISF